MDSGGGIVVNMLAFYLTIRVQIPPKSTGLSVLRLLDKFENKPIGNDFESYFKLRFFKGVAYFRKVSITYVVYVFLGTTYHLRK